MDARERRVQQERRQLRVEEALKGRGGGAIRLPTAKAPPSLTPEASAAFEQLHPRAGGGKFGAKAKPPVESKAELARKSALTRGVGERKNAAGKPWPPVEPPKPVVPPTGKASPDLPRATHDTPQVVFDPNATLDPSEVQDNRAADYARASLTKVFVPNPGGKTGQWVEKGHVTEKEQRAIDREAKRVRDQKIAGKKRTLSTGAPSEHDAAIEQRIEESLKGRGGTRVKTAKQPTQPTNQQFEQLHPRAQGGKFGAKPKAAAPAKNTGRALQSLAVAHPPPSGGGPYNCDDAGNTKAEGGSAPFTYNSDGYTKAGFDSDGFDEDGYMADGFDAPAPDGQDADGFDRNGFNDNGEDRSGKSWYDASGNWIGPAGQDPNDQPDDPNQQYDENGMPIDNSPDPSPDAAPADGSPGAGDAIGTGAGTGTKGGAPGKGSAPGKAGPATKGAKPKAGRKSARSDGSNRTAAQLRADSKRMARALVRKEKRIAKRNARARASQASLHAQHPGRPTGAASAAMRGQRPGKVREAAIERRVEEALHARGGGELQHFGHLAAKFDAKLHPRGRGGKWRETFTSEMGSPPDSGGARPKPRQPFATAFGGGSRPHAGEMGSPADTGGGIQLTQEEHRVAFGLGADPPTSEAELRALRDRFSYPIGRSPDDGGARFRAQANATRRSMLAKIDKALATGQPLVGHPREAPKPVERVDPYAARIARVKAAIGLDVTDGEASFLPHDALAGMSLLQVRREVADNYPSPSPDDGGPYFRKMARADHKSLIAKIDAAIRVRGSGSTGAGLTGNEPESRDAHRARMLDSSGSNARLLKRTVAERNVQAEVDRRIQRLRDGEMGSPAEPYTPSEATIHNNLSFYGGDRAKTIAALKADHERVRRFMDTPEMRREARQEREHESRVSSPPDVGATPPPVQAGDVFVNRSNALIAMAPGEHRMIDGVYVSRQDNGDWTVHHPFGSPRFQNTGREGASDRNLTIPAALDSLNGAAEAAKTSPNMMVVPMMQATQLEDGLKPGDKVAARWTNNHNFHGANATVVRVNRASIKVSIDDGIPGYLPAGHVITLPRHQPFQTNSRWSLNNRVAPRSAELDTHLARLAARSSSEPAPPTPAEVAARARAALAASPARRNARVEPPATLGLGTTTDDLTANRARAGQVTPGVAPVPAPGGWSYTDATGAFGRGAPSARAAAPAPAPAPAAPAPAPIAPDRTTRSGIVGSPGRGPTGRLRNFHAMTNEKLARTARDLMAYRGDLEAVDAVIAEMGRRRDAGSMQSPADLGFSAESGRRAARRTMGVGEFRIPPGEVGHAEALQRAQAGVGHAETLHRAAQANSRAARARVGPIGGEMASPAEPPPAFQALSAEDKRFVEMALGGSVEGVTQDEMIGAVDATGLTPTRTRVLRALRRGAPSGGEMASPAEPTGGIAPGARGLTADKIKAGVLAYNAAYNQNGEVTAHVADGTPMLRVSVASDSGSGWQFTIVTTPGVRGADGSWASAGTPHVTSWRALRGTEKPGAAAKRAAKRAFPDAQVPVQVFQQGPGGAKLIEAEFSTAQREKLAKQGKAMPHGGFPIRNAEDLSNAIHAIGRAKNPQAAKAHIIARAKALGLTSKLPEGWRVQEAEMGPDHDRAIERRVQSVLEAKDSMLKASTPEPFSTSKTSNWVARGGGLPAYIQHIAHALVRKRGMPESQAIAIAIGTVKRWARGGGDVDANTRAAAAKALAEWEALKAKSHAKSAVKAGARAAS